MLRVLLIARISTVHQDARSLDDQAALCERYVRDRYPGPVQFTLIQGRGSGETLDRQDLADAEAAVESGAYDLVVVEDLGRICRRNRAIDFCELCEDAGTRLIAVNDSIDTARDDWRLNAFFASLKHESGNKDTSRRIRRSLRNRFEQGGVVQTFQYGYVKPPGATSDADVTKDPAAEPVYEEWFRRLEGGASYSEVADWLNAQGVPTGPWARSGRWTGAMVARLTRNPILKGVRTAERADEPAGEQDGPAAVGQGPAVGASGPARPPPGVHRAGPVRPPDRPAGRPARRLRPRAEGRHGGHPGRSLEEADGVAGPARRLRRLRPDVLLGRARPGRPPDVFRGPGLRLLERGHVRRGRGRAGEWPRPS